MIDPWPFTPDFRPHLIELAAPFLLLVAIAVVKLLRSRDR